MSAPPPGICGRARTGHDGGSDKSIREVPALPRAALRPILPIAGWPAERADTVTISDRTDPVLPTPFRIGTAGAATLAATGLAAAQLWRERNRGGRAMRTQLRHAPTSL